MSTIVEFEVDPVGQLRKELGQHGWFHRIVRKWRTRRHRILRERELAEVRLKIAPHEYPFEKEEKKIERIFLVGIAVCCILFSLPVLI